jgi:hypothetical protein
MSPFMNLDGKGWKDLSDGLNWEVQLSIDLPREERQWLIRHVLTGRPLATDGWLSKLENALGRRLRALPVGRPKKTAKAAKAKMRNR